MRPNCRHGAQSGARNPGASDPQWLFLLKMAVRSNSLMPFSIQAILNRKEESRHLNDLDVCFSKSECWKIFEEMDGADRSDERESKNYDSDSGLSEDNDTKAQSDAKPEKDADLAEETDQELKHGKGLSDCVSGEWRTVPLTPAGTLIHHCSLFKLKHWDRSHMEPLQVLYSENKVINMFVTLRKIGSFKNLVLCGSKNGSLSWLEKYLTILFKLIVILLRLKFPNVATSRLVILHPPNSD